MPGRPPNPFLHLPRQWNTRVRSAVLHVVSLAHLALTAARARAIDPNAARGTITYYELPVSSLMGVPGARDAPLKTIRSKRLDEFGLPGEGWRVAA